MARSILGGSKPDAPGTSRFFRGERRSVQSMWPARDDGLDRRRQAPVLAGTSLTLRCAGEQNSRRAIRFVKPEPLSAGSMPAVMARGLFLCYPTCSGKSIDQHALPVNVFFGAEGPAFGLCRLRTMSDAAKPLRIGVGIEYSLVQIV